MKIYDKLLFVDKSNTSLGPMAEAIAAKDLMLEDILVSSRGLVVLFPEPVNPKVEAILVSNSLSLKEHSSEALEESDFDSRTLIIAMSDEIKKSIADKFENPVNTVSLEEYLNIPAGVADPYGGTLQDYGQCFKQLSTYIKLLTDKLKQEDM